jgi:hypothetical protein
MARIFPHGARLKLGTQFYDDAVIRLSLNEGERDLVEDVTFATTGALVKRVVPVHDPGSFSVTMQYTFAKWKEIRDLIGTTVAFEIHFPLESGQTTPGKLTGNGIVHNLRPEMAERQAIDMTFDVDISGTVTVVDPT